MVKSKTHWEQNTNNKCFSVEFKDFIAGKLNPEEKSKYHVLPCWIKNNSAEREKHKTPIFTENNKQYRFDRSSAVRLVLDQKDNLSYNCLESQACPTHTSSDAMLWSR